MMRETEWGGFGDKDEEGTRSMKDTPARGGGAAKHGGVAIASRGGVESSASSGTSQVGSRA